MMEGEGEVKVGTKGDAEVEASALLVRMVKGDISNFCEAAESFGRRQRYETERLSHGYRRDFIPWAETDSAY